VIFLKQEQKPVSLKTQKTRIKKNKETCELFFLNPGFFNPDYLLILFCDFPLVARPGKSHVTISLIGCALHT